MERRKEVAWRNNDAKSKGNEFIFGTRAVIEAIEAGKEAEKIFIQKGLQNDLIKELISNRALKIFTL